jgi:factor associated with neutral sphingomyelinase activation
MNRKPSSSSAIQFFWDRKNNKNRSRFNLLLLEYGEYLLEDLSVYYFPIPTHDLSTAFEVKDSLKIQGRLKLCTRSLMFEPAETRYPILRFPFKNIQGALEAFNLKESEKREMSVDVSGYFTFNVQSSIEMKENNKIGPFKYIDYASAGGHRSVFALVHADLTQFLVKVEQLRHILSVSQKQGTGAGAQLLKPFIEAAQLWTLQFDTSLLVNFHEKLLFNKPLAAKKIKPLIINPGSLMLTEARVYFQPAQLNNIGDSVLHFDVRSISRVFRRRYLLQQTGLEFILSDNSSHLFVLDSAPLRDMAYGLLVNLRALSPQARGDAPLSPVVASRGSTGALGTASALEVLCRRWQRRELSNFEYLTLLNSEADRSMNDLTQYPVYGPSLFLAPCTKVSHLYLDICARLLTQVFPHVIADYSSRKLDLDKPSTFRDLTKPIGALNPERLAYFKQRMQSMPPPDPALGGS